MADQGRGEVVVPSSPSASSSPNASTVKGKVASSRRPGSPDRSSTGSSQGGTKVVAPQNQQFVYTTIPRQYSGARSGVLTHVSCTVDARQIEAAQSEALKNSTKGFSCIECGLPFLNMQALRAHAQCKTVWTDRGLLGCRISVMWAHNHWYEGTVTQFDMLSGKHCVLYDDGEEKWYQMSCKTFNIVSRDNALQETKAELELEEKSSADEGRLTDEYLAAQSLVYLAFGNSAQQVGYRTDGHMCVTDADRFLADESGSSLLYGEVLPRGVHKMLDEDHLNAAGAKVLYDCGMGTGKLALQAWLQFRNLEKVVGIELAISRFTLGERALASLARARPDDFEILTHIEGEEIVMRDKRDPRRTLEFYRCDLFSYEAVSEADIAILQTNFPPETYVRLCALLMQLKSDCRLLTYLNLSSLFKGASWIFRQLPANRSLEDRFPTSWSIHRGCHFFLWEKRGREFWEEYGGLAVMEQNHDPYDRPASCLGGIFRCFTTPINSRVQHGDERN